MSDEFDPNEPLHIPLTDELDLHTFHPKETKSLVEEYIIECVRLRFRRIRIIHGKGKSVQKHIVSKALEKNPHVESFSDAPPGSGGWGATIAILKLPKQNDQ